MLVSELISSSPALSWPANQRQTVKVSFTPREGLVIGDYGTFTLTVREDPLWDSGHGRRKGGDLQKRRWADPVNDGWEAAESAAGTYAAGFITFEVTVPDGVGQQRYAVDVVADGGAAGRVQIVDATWLTVEPSLKAA